jgi:hypothetical protein
LRRLFGRTVCKVLSNTKRTEQDPIALSKRGAVWLQWIRALFIAAKEVVCDNRVIRQASPAYLKCGGT